MRQDAIKYAFLVLLLCLGFVAALGSGVINISLFDTAAILIHRMTGILANPLTQGILGDVIWQLRLPRFFAACFAGAGLAVCGVVIQAVVRNPLADPYILGISSGAGLGATAAVALRLSHVLGQNSMGVFALLGALVASFLILLFASRSRQKDSFHLLLIGMGLNVICSWEACCRFSGMGFGFLPSLFCSALLFSVRSKKFLICCCSMMRPCLRWDCVCSVIDRSMLCSVPPSSASLYMKRA